MRRLILIAALVLVLTLPAMAQGAIPQPVYFWGSVAAMISAPGQPPAPEVIRPSAIGMFADGSWDIDHLHWTGWGSSVARATGISSASNGIPNMAQGKRTKKPAQVTLSNPGLFQGREVYRCFTLTVPPAATGAPSCLTDRGGYWSLSGTSPSGSTAPTTTAATTPTPSTYARFYTPTGNIACEMFDDGTAKASIGCIMQKPPALASLKTSGVATICQHHGLNCTGNLGDAPSLAPPRELPYGSSKTVGRFRCGSEQTGVTCTMITSGKGFLINSTGITLVGGANSTSAGATALHLGDFLSPDRKVWCGIGSAQSFCATGRPGLANPHQRGATIYSDGRVTLCDVPVPSLRAGCIQNWDFSAPILRVGQESEMDGVLCKSGTNGITCTLTSGPGAGKGFLVSSSSVRRVGP